jgi:hypothetical protein
MYKTNSNFGTKGVYAYWRRVTAIDPARCHRQSIQLELTNL